MKTSELTKRVKNELSLKAVVEGLYIVFYEWDADEEFYKYPVDGTEAGAGISYMRNIGNVSMKDIFNLGEMLKEYRKTPVNERKEEKKYYVWAENIKQDCISVICVDEPYYFTPEERDTFGFTDYRCESVEWFDREVYNRYRKLAQLTEKDIMRLPEKFIPKQFGGMGFTECVEVR